MNITVNDVKKVALWFIQSYKNTYNNKKNRDILLVKYTGNDSTFEQKYCIQVSTVALAVSNVLKVDYNKVLNLLKNSTTNNLPQVKYNVKRKGSYCSGAINHYYYLGDVK